MAPASLQTGEIRPEIPGEHLQVGMKPPLFHQDHVGMSRYFTRLDYVCKTSIFAETPILSAELTLFVN